MTLCIVHLQWKQIMGDTSYPRVRNATETFIILVAWQTSEQKSMNKSATSQSLGKQWTTGAGTCVW